LPCRFWSLLPEYFSAKMVAFEDVRNQISNMNLCTRKSYGNENCAVIPSWRYWSWKV
jgi:hypothetical protein